MNDALPSKIFGARLSWTFEGVTKTQTNWYSTNEQEAQACLLKAQAIAPPANCAIVWETVSDDVRILSPGIYRTDKKRLVEIYDVGPFVVRGCFLKPNRQRLQHEHCQFYANGAPTTHKNCGSIADLVA